MRLVDVVGGAFLLPYFVIVFTFGVATVTFALPLWLMRKCSQSLTMNCRSRKKDRQTLVILGTGWGSYTVLAELDHERYNIIVVSPRAHFLFTPLLCGTTVGTTETRSVLEPLLCTSATNYRFILGEAVKIDFSSRKISCQRNGHADPMLIGYDRLVIGVGATTNTFGVEGAEEHAFFLKEASHAEIIRRKLLGNLHLAIQPNVEDDLRRKLLSIAIVGAGPTGVEFAAELYDFFKQDCKALHDDIMNFLSISIIERSGMLSSFDPKLQQYVSDLLGGRSCVKFIRSSVTKVMENGVMLQDGTTVSSSIVVWTAGITQRPLTTGLNIPKSSSGRILVDDHLSVKFDSAGENMAHRVYALGDCAEIANNNLPCTAQVAMREGIYLANLLNKSSGNHFQKHAAACSPFVYKSLGQMAYVGDNRAVAHVMMPCFSTRLTGAIAFFIWRCSYLLRLYSWRLRLQVPIDWFKAAVFGRDCSIF